MGNAGTVKRLCPCQPSLWSSCAAHSAQNAAARLTCGLRAGLMHPGQQEAGPEAESEKPQWWQVMQVPLSLVVASLCLRLKRPYSGSQPCLARPWKFDRKVAITASSQRHTRNMALQVPIQQAQSSPPVRDRHIRQVTGTSLSPRARHKGTPACQADNFHCSLTACSVGCQALWAAEEPGKPGEE